MCDIDIIITLCTLKKYILNIFSLIAFYLNTVVSLLVVGMLQSQQDH